MSFFQFIVDLTQIPFRSRYQISPAPGLVLSYERYRQESGNRGTDYRKECEIGANLRGTVRRRLVMKSFESEEKKMSFISFM